MDQNQSLISKDPRIRFAAERTLLAWVRTGLAMMGFGFVVARFGLFLREISKTPVSEVEHGPRFSLWIGTALILLGVSVSLFASRQHYFGMKRLEKGEPYVVLGGSLSFIIAIVLGIIGLAMAAYLFYL